MRLIDADAFKEYIWNAYEQVKHMYPDGGKWARQITEDFCKDIDEQPTIDNSNTSNTLGALDCVERQAAMKIRFSSGFDHDGILFVPYRDVEEHLKKLPSVQPKQKWETCFDCPLSHGCPKINGCTNGQTMEYASEIPDDCPIPVQPRRGKWIETEFLKLRECSCCHVRWGMYDVENFDFCPNCGADMRQRDDER